MAIKLQENSVGAAGSWIEESSALRIVSVTRTLELAPWVGHISVFDGAYNENEMTVSTKREILSTVSRLFDLLEFWFKQNWSCKRHVVRLGWNEPLMGDFCRHVYTEDLRGIGAIQGVMQSNLKLWCGTLQFTCILRRFTKSLYLQTIDTSDNSSYLLIMF